MVSDDSELFRVLVEDGKSSVIILHDCNAFCPGNNRSILCILLPTLVRDSITQSAPSKHGFTRVNINFH